MALDKERITIMRRSTAMAPHLPLDQLLWLLDELERMVKDEEQVTATMARMAGPWEEVRSSLNELHHLGRC